MQMEDELIRLDSRWAADESADNSLSLGVVVTVDYLTNVGKYLHS